MSINCSTSQHMSVSLPRRYSDAASIRDRLNELEATSREAAATVSENRVKPEFRLGQRIVHKHKGFKGVICGWDVQCCESSVWQKDSGVEALSAGTNQPFYHVSIQSRKLASPCDSHQSCGVMNHANALRTDA